MGTMRAGGGRQKLLESVNGQYDQQQSSMFAPTVFIKLKGTNTGDPIRRARADINSEVEGVEVELKGPAKPHANSFQGVNSGNGLQQSEKFAAGEHEAGMVWSKNSNAAEKRLNK